MGQQVRGRVALLLAAWVLVSLLGVAGSGAASAAAEADVGLLVESARVAADGSQVSLALTTDNPGPAFSGWVETRGVERRTLSAVEVPAGTGRADVWTSPGDTGGGLSVRLLDASERPVSAWQDLALDYGSSVLVVGARSADYSFLADVLGMDVERGSSLPADRREYGLHAAVVLAAAESAEPAGKADGLVEWVRGGGLLVWAAGYEPLPADAGPAGLAVPATPAERVTLQERSPIMVSAMGSEPVSLSQPGLDAGTDVTTLTQTAEQPDLVYTLADGAVIMVAAPEGLGRAAVAGLVPSGRAGDDAADTGLSAYWQSLFAGAGPPMPGATTSEGAAPHGYVTGRVPSLWLTIGLAALYTALVGVGLFAWLRRPRRRDALWWVIPMVVVVCTAGVLAAGLTLRGSNAVVVTRLNVVALPDGSVPVAYRAVGVYAPWGAEVGLALPGGAFAGPPAPGGVPGLEGPYTVRQKAGVVGIEGLRVAPGSGRSVVYGETTGRPLGVSAGGAAPAAAGGAAGSVWPWRFDERRSGGSVTWAVTNLSDRTLRFVTVLADGLWALPDLPPGASASFEVAAGRVVGGDARRSAEQPRPTDGADLVEWDASRRLHDEWWAWDGPGGPEVPATAPVPPGAVERSTPPIVSPTETRVLAWADDDAPGVAVSGIPADSEVEAVVVYEAVLR